MCLRTMESIYSNRHQSLFWVIETENRYLFNMEKHQKMERDHVSTRVAFCSKIANSCIDAENIIWTSECTFRILPRDSWKDDLSLFEKWAHSGEELPDVEIKNFEQVHVFVALIGDEVIGPFFCDEFSTDKKKALDSDAYVLMLQNKVIPALKNSLGDYFKSCWFQQDVGVESKSIDYLKSVFDDKLISSGTGLDTEWPPNSQDLNVVNYWFWPGLIPLIYKHDPETAQELKSFVKVACSLIKPKLVAKAIDEFRFCIETLIYAKGVHFEELLLSRKTIHPICSICK